PVVYLPDGVAIADDPALSPLLSADPSLAGTADLPGHPGTQCAGFYFRPDGSTGTALTPANNFLTLRADRGPEAASGAAPRDYYTLQVNPVTGKVTSFRP
ncbi:MAG TPA: hypothetical protein VIM58_07230, partial [Candidatus Methylacidiphilales bacterium]